MNKPRVVVEYCARCGFMLRAAWVAQELLKSFEDEIAEVALRPGGGGIFVLRLDEAVLFSNQDEGRFPEMRELRERLAQALGSGKRFGHRAAADDA
ncbi:MAG: Rdx family protein [Gammaproteobacteria bacterium]|nr:Rdx family protein [Gammaproteobacteria bacterium]